MAAVECASQVLIGLALTIAAFTFLNGRAFYVVFFRSFKVPFKKQIFVSSGQGQIQPVGLGGQFQ